VIQKYAQTSSSAPLEDQEGWRVTEAETAAHRDQRPGKGPGPLEGGRGMSPRHYTAVPPRQAALLRLTTAIAAARTRANCTSRSSADCMTKDWVQRRRHSAGGRK
jgi:hypothetical protein